MARRMLHIFFHFLIEKRKYNPTPNIKTSMILLPTMIIYLRLQKPFGFRIQFMVNNKVITCWFGLVLKNKFWLMHSILVFKKLFNRVSNQDGNI